LPASDPLCIGIIVAVHGVRGQIKIKSFAQVPEDIFSYSPLTIASRNTVLHLKPAGVSGNSLLATIEGVTSRDAAEALKGQKLYVDRAQLPALTEEEFYIEDLQGLTVISPGGIKLGTVIAAHHYGAGDLLEIETAPKETSLYAFTRATFPEIDLDARTLTFVPPEEIE
jgi:16S rRNA processing protein RimM